MMCSSSEYGIKVEFNSTNNTCFDRLHPHQKKSQKDVLQQTSNSFDLKQRKFKELSSRVPSFRQEGYKKGEFFANILGHLESDPMRASNFVKTPKVRFDFKRGKELYFQSLQNKRVMTTTAFKGNKVVNSLNLTQTSLRTKHSQSVRKDREQGL